MEVVKRPRGEAAGLAQASAAALVQIDQHVPSVLQVVVRCDWVPANAVGFEHVALQCRNCLRCDLEIAAR